MQMTTATHTIRCLMLKGCETMLVMQHTTTASQMTAAAAQTWNVRLDSWK